MGQNLLWYQDMIKNTRKRRLLIPSLIASGVLVAAFQNCSDAQYEFSSVPQKSVTATTPGAPTPPLDPNPGDGLEVLKGTVVVPVKTRDEEQLPLVKMVLVVDNSGSMASYQTQLAQGFQGVLDQLKKQHLNVEFYLYSTSSAPGFAKASAEALPIEFYTIDEKPANATDVKAIPHRERLKSRLAPSLVAISGKPLMIHADMTPTEIADVAAMLYDKVKNMGTSGSGAESGICSLLRVTKEKGLNKVLQSGDRVAFLILSDENDVITGSNCIDATDDVYTNVATEMRCASTTADCKAPYTYRGTYKDSNGNVQTLTLAGQSQKNFCANSFMVGGKTYANFAAYAADKLPNVKSGDWVEACFVSGLVDVLKKTAVEIKSNLVSAGTEPGAELKTQLDTFLGPLNYRISFVINDQKANQFEDCPITQNVTFGFKYRALADSIAGSQVTSICAKSYAVALGNLGKFVESIALRSYKIEIPEKAVVIEVKLVRAGVTQILGAADFSFSLDCSLVLREGLLAPGDQLLVKWEGFANP